MTTVKTDTGTAAAALGLVALASTVGGALYLSGHPVHATSAPLEAAWLPHAGPGTPLAIAVAALVVWHGPRLADTLSWPRLLATGYATALAWIVSLALVDGWQRGLAGRLTTKDEYLSEVGGVTDVSTMLRGFAGRILDFQPDSWTTHVSGHPPGAFLTFIALERIGLGGGAWAAILCVVVGALTVVAIAVTIRVLGDEAAARAALPFLVLFPGAVWIGASADGLFAGVTATGLALLAVAATRGSLAVGLGAGVLLGFGIFLSYGLTLIAVLALAVLVLAWRVRTLSVGVVVAALVGAVAVVGGFAAAGFWWVDGYHLVVQRYYQGIASRRPYAYWVWANLAAAVVCAGPTAVVILRRAAVTLARTRRPAPPSPSAPQSTGPAVPSVDQVVPSVGLAARPSIGLVDLASSSSIGVGASPAVMVSSIGPAVVLPLAGLVAILAADASGLSKAEVERIWLPFAVWFAAGAALLPRPDRRTWLIVQTSTALLVNHLLLTSW